MFKATLTLATSVFLLMSGAADLFAMESLDDVCSQQKTMKKAQPTIDSEIFPNLPNEMGSRIIEYAAFEQCLNDELPVNLVLVCKAWHKETQYHMEPGKRCYKAWYGIYGHEDIYETFFKGVLLYRPNLDSDEGMITLKISELKEPSSEGTSYKLLKKNPLEGTFDLSTCGDAGKYLVISTGHRKGKKAENNNKIEIWLAPKFIIEKNLKSSAGHLQPIMSDWNEEIAPIGIFWTWGGWDNLNGYDYLSNKTLADIGSKNLYENWACVVNAETMGGPWVMPYGVVRPAMERVSSFRVHL